MQDLGGRSGHRLAWIPVVMSALLLMIVVGTSLWVAADATSRGLRSGDGNGLFDMGPGGWLFACLLFWIVAFPAYLIRRSRASNDTPEFWTAPPRAVSASSRAPLVSPSQRFCKSCGSGPETGPLCGGCGAPLDIR